MRTNGSVVLPSSASVRYGRPLSRGRELPFSLDDEEEQNSPKFNGAFSLANLRRDALAGTVTGLMAIPLTVGICLMSEYPIQVGMATVAAACVVSFLVYLIRPGNHVGVPGIAAGLAPVLALGVHKFGIENMPALIFLTAVFQGLIWKYRLEGYVLKLVPAFLVEGLLAGVGVKIALKFLPDAYAVTAASDVFWSNDRLLVVACSIGALFGFLYLYRRFKDKSPGIPYIAVIAIGIWIATKVDVPMLHVDRIELKWALPIPKIANWTPTLIVEMLVYSGMLAVIDVIEQVMSNAAIEKIDPLGRKADSNNSILVMWIANLVASFFGGMTNLDGLAKSSTNRMAGAITKTSALFVAVVIGIFVIRPDLLHHLPIFSLAVLMLFTGWKMISGLFHVAEHGRYELGLALVCCVLVFRLGIFEGLLICLVIHSFIVFVIYRHEEIPIIEVARRFMLLFIDGKHPHSTDTMDVRKDVVSGGYVYSSLSKAPADKKNLEDFIADWACGINARNLLSVTSTYDVNGLLWGTFAKDLRAGHGNIKRYFESLFEHDDLRVTFLSGETRQYDNIFIKSGSYSFSFRKKGQVIQVPARYSFVCKREKTGWYIVEHHSSEFPA